MNISSIYMYINSITIDSYNCIYVNEKNNLGRYIDKAISDVRKAPERDA